MTFQNSLLTWFEKNQRPLPWRKNYNPYEVWISEIMLQQTQMETVLPYYDRWLRLFPDVQTLAKSDSKKVLKAWEGLGYYSRARNLHESAKKIIDFHGGEIPSDFESIRALKGVGRYTAGAIASIAFNQDKPIVDGNILRVLSRVYAIKKAIDLPQNQEYFWGLQEKLIPPGRAREFNQALMELGALVCSPANPSCPVCPLQKFCKAYKNGDPENYPVKTKKTRSVKVTASAVVFEHKDLFLIHLRPLGKVMGGLWEFPEWKLSKNLEMTPASLLKKTRREVEKFGAGKALLEPLGAIRRNYTYFNESLSVFFCRTDFFETATGWPSVWVPRRDFAKYPFSSAHAKIAKMITEKIKS